MTQSILPNEDIMTEGAPAVAEEYNTYICNYRFDDGEWGFEIKARSFAEAHERVKAMGWARVDGELIAKIPVPYGNMVERLIAWCRPPTGERTKGGVDESLSVSTRCRQPTANRAELLDEIENLKTRVAVMTGELNRRQSDHTSVAFDRKGLLEAMQPYLLPFHIDDSDVQQLADAIQRHLGIDPPERSCRVRHDSGNQT